MKFKTLKEIPPPIQLRMKVRKGDESVVPSVIVECKQCGSDCWESKSMGAFGKFGTTICDDCMNELAKNEQ